MDEMAFGAEDEDPRCVKCGAEPEPNHGHCNLCCESIPGTPEQIIDHIRLIHPDIYGDGPMRWPDGGLVVFDGTLEPEDFGD